MEIIKYRDRQQAGIELAFLLQDYANQPDVLVLALPRGGVPVAYEITNRLNLPLDVLIVRKLGVPFHEELAMGAIASGETVILNTELIHSLQINQASIDEVLQTEKLELRRREERYRGYKPYPDLQGKTIILVDDGIATGFTMKAAIAALNKKQIKSIVVAVPVAARETCLELAPLVDKLICPRQPINFYAVGVWYENFSQTTDDEVIDLLGIQNNN